MLTIKRGCSNKIITRALNSENRPLVALLMPDAEDCEPCLDQDQLQARLDSSPQAMIVYNQQSDAIALVEALRVSPEQIFIEVRQDTKGVLGLEAFHKKNHQPEAMGLLHE